ncbi:MAG TPA: DNA-directed RNA polymerase subunit omega [Pseudobdellovibrionaceae bacterium]|jgi:DNA-directed RNA polymerase subunit omega|nr:DNA-directed RNA polymerase subunit omega [Pseudobdellovibrionaceae bacterium]
MARVTVEDCLDKVENRFALVLLVSKRSKQLLRGSNPTVSGKQNKYVVTALREVAAGNVRFEAVDEAEQIAQVESDLNR